MNYTEVPKGAGWHAVTLKIEVPAHPGGWRLVRDALRCVLLGRPIPLTVLDAEVSVHVEAEGAVRFYRPTVRLTGGGAHEPS